MRHTTITLLRALLFPARLLVRLAAKATRPSSERDRRWQPPLDETRHLWAAVEEQRQNDPEARFWRLAEARRAQAGPTEAKGSGAAGQQDAVTDNVHETEASAEASPRPRVLGRVRRRGLAIPLALVVALCVASGAFAYFSVVVTGSGSGTGLNSGSTTATLTFTPGTPTTALYPGASADVKLTVANVNTFEAKIPSLVLDTSQGTGGFAVDATHAGAGCTVSAADLTFTTQNNGGSGWSVPANTSDYGIDLTGSLAMGTGAANACQGASFTVYLKAGS